MSRKSSERILVADDDATSRKLLARILSSAGFYSTQAADGIEALKMLHAEPPSLLLLDFDMPGMDGAEVLKQLRQDSDAAIAQIPTIMLTGHGGEESEVLCLEAGADDFVTKPINQAVLRARIDTQLRLRSMRRAGPTSPSSVPGIRDSPRPCSSRSLESRSSCSKRVSPAGAHRVAMAVR